MGTKFLFVFCRYGRLRGTNSQERMEILQVFHVVSWDEAGAGGAGDETGWGWNNHTVSEAGNSCVITDQIKFSYLVRRCLGFGGRFGMGF